MTERCPHQFSHRRDTYERSEKLRVHVLDATTQTTARDKTNSQDTGITVLPRYWSHLLLGGSETRHILQSTPNIGQYLQVPYVLKNYLFDMQYKVFTVEFLGQSNKANHVAIYVETKPKSDDIEGSGIKYHVVGTILLGIKYERQISDNYMLSPEHVDGADRLIGRISEADVPLLEEICKSVPPPAAQMALNGRRRDPAKPLRRCGEWVQEVVAKALAEGVLKESDVVDDDNGGQVKREA